MTIIFHSARCLHEGSSLCVSVLLRCAHQIAVSVVLGVLGVSFAVLGATFVVTCGSLGQNRVVLALISAVSDILLRHFQEVSLSQTLVFNRSATLLLIGGILFWLVTLLILVAQGCSDARWHAVQGQRLILITVRTTEGSDHDHFFLL